MRRTVLSAVLASAALLSGCASHSPGPAAPAIVTVRVDQAGRDKRFEFTLHGVETGLKSVGRSGFVQNTAAGTYVIATFWIKNITTGPQDFRNSDVTLVDTQGRRFAVDDSATMTYNLDHAVDPTYTGMPAGKILVARMVFDVPMDAVLSHVMFLDDVKATLL
ncbi:DUF4352 domain-containing protein [Nocardia sp. NPDC020380]|uniref:DUF4352 domain-containing protein n=1 Tax=Nocardia sp. NPDC020380 TaxID=3364309 RepID=UPI0037B5FFB0